MPASRPITGIDLSTGGPYSALAWGDGNNDDTAVIQAALNVCGLIKVPAGTYNLTSTLSIPPIDGAGIIGDGAAIKNVQASTAGTVFVANFASGDIITCPQHLTHPTFRGFVLDRSVTPTSGIGLNLSIICDAALIDDVWSKHSVIGFYFGTTGYSSANNLHAEANTSHGFQIVGQWQLSKLVALLNGGCGFYVAGIISGGNSNGQWTGLATFGNGSHGIWIDGSVNAVHSIRISDSFIGADGGHGILDDSHSSTPNLYTNVYVEGEPGDGFNFTANAGNVSLVNCVASCLGSGVKSFAAATSIHGGQFMQNHSYGVWIVQNHASIVGANISGNMAYGIGASFGVNGLAVAGCRLAGNTSGPFDTSVASGVQLAANVGGAFPAV